MATGKMKCGRNGECKIERDREGERRRETQRKRRKEKGKSLEKYRNGGKEEREPNREECWKEREMPCRIGTETRRAKDKHRESDRDMETQTYIGSGRKIGLQEDRYTGTGTLNIREIFEKEGGV